jgi:hypothetical protein
MKEDFIWLGIIINSSKNKTKHVDAINTLVNLFEKKWSHCKNHPTHKRIYSIYVSYLCIKLNKLKSLHN